MASSRATGFSLIELLVVIAIILILAALAIPQLLHAKISANEAAAVSAVRTLHTAELEYAQLFPASGFADDLAKLGPTSGGAPPTPANAGLVDFLLGCASQPCLRGGYLFQVDQTSGAPPDTFRVTAVPQAVGQTGLRGFCMSLAGSITYDPNGGRACSNTL